MCFTNQLQASLKFELDSDLVHMRSGFATVRLYIFIYYQGFYELFGQGFDLYLNGEWESAREVLSEVEKVKGAPDYPTRCLLSVMEEQSFFAPQDWTGCRHLVEK